MKSKIFIISLGTVFCSCQSSNQTSKPTSTTHAVIRQKDSISDQVQSRNSSVPFDIQPHPEAVSKIACWKPSARDLSCREEELKNSQVDPKSKKNQVGVDSADRIRSLLISEQIEKQLAEWAPRPHDRDVPVAVIRDPRIDIEGHWMIDSKYDDSTMNLALLPSKHYSVEINSSGCGLEWNLQRTAIFQDGILLFERPVEVRGLGTFDRLFAVRLDGRPCLLPPCHVAHVNRELERTGVIGTSSGLIERCTFGRTGERLSYSERFIDPVTPD